MDEVQKKKTVSKPDSVGPHIQPACRTVHKSSISLKTVCIRKQVPSSFHKFQRVDGLEFPFWNFSSGDTHARDWHNILKENIIVGRSWVHTISFLAKVCQWKPIWNSCII